MRAQGQGASPLGLLGPQTQEGSGLAGRSGRGPPCSTQNPAWGGYCPGSHSDWDTEAGSPAPFTLLSTVYLDGYVLRRHSAE